MKILYEYLTEYTTLFGRKEECVVIVYEEKNVLKKMYIHGYKKQIKEEAKKQC